MIFPERLKAGDKIAIISPASAVRPEFIDKAVSFIKKTGFEPVTMPWAKGPADGNFAASLEKRLDDFIAAWNMPDVKAVLCSRGGYGAVHLIPRIPDNLLRDNPRWLIGFSDISALHALSLKQGVASVHGPMARHYDSMNSSVAGVIGILTSGVMPECRAQVPEGTGCSWPENQPGEAEGILMGGNLAVLDGLSATDYDIFERSAAENVILFIEDIAEPVYKIERILYRLYLQGVFTRLKGIAVGRFTEYNPDPKHGCMERMIDNFLREHGLDSLPVGYGFPFGHIEENMPLVEGATVRLSVTPGSASLTQIRTLD